MKATKVVVEKVNNNVVEVLGKTYDSVTFSGDVNSREKVKRALITLEDVDEGMTVRGEGRDTLIRKVKAENKVELRVQLLNAEGIDDGKSLASVFVKGVWTADDAENPGMIDVFVAESDENVAALNQLRNIAKALAETPTGLRALGKWYPVVDGKRVIIRLVAEIEKTGRIERPVVSLEPECGCDCGCDDCGDDDDDGDGDTF